MNCFGYCSVVGSWRQLPKTNMKWSDDDKFTSRKKKKGKSQTRGPRKKYHSLYYCVSTSLLTGLKSGRCEKELFESMKKLLNCSLSQWEGSLASKVVPCPLLLTDWPFLRNVYVWPFLVSTARILLIDLLLSVTLLVIKFICGESLPLHCTKHCSSRVASAMKKQKKWVLKKKMCRRFKKLAPGDIYFVRFTRQIWNMPQEVTM